MRLSRIDQHIKDEPFAKQRALLGIVSIRYSSRFSRCPICWSFFTISPLVLESSYGDLFMFMDLFCYGRLDKNGAEVDNWILPVVSLSL
jgi:hypothetical protein